MITVAPDFSNMKIGGDNIVLMLGKPAVPSMGLKSKLFRVKCYGYMGLDLGLLVNHFRKYRKKESG
jgi:hypothetical protein